MSKNDKAGKKGNAGKDAAPVDTVTSTNLSATQVNVDKGALENQAALDSPTCDQPAPAAPVYNQAYQPAQGAPVYNQGYQPAPAAPVYNQGYQPAPGAPAYNQFPAGTPTYNQAPYGAPVYNQPPLATSTGKKKDSFLFRTVMIILSVFLGVAILGFAGCASCAMFIGQVDDFAVRGPETYVPESDLPIIPFDGDDYKEAVPGDAKESFSLEELLAYSSQLENITLNGKTSAGGYYIGTPSDSTTPMLEVGEYFFEGSNDDENELTVFSKEAGSNHYTVAYSMSFYGNFMTDLKDGEFLIYEPSNSISTMYPLKKEAFKVESENPYISGLYRVGIDIPAGTYSITGDTRIDDDDMPMGAYVYESLDFVDPKNTVSEHLLSKVAKEVTVEDGQYLEIYKGIATKL